MSISRFAGFFLAITLGFAASAMAADVDHQWSLSGSLNIGAENEILVGVTNNEDLGAASPEVHYDTTLLELADPASIYNSTALVGRAADASNFVLFPSKNAGWDFIRLTMYTTGESVPAGSGDIAKVLFRLKDTAQVGQTTTITLTDKDADFTLATLDLEIQGVLNEPPQFTTEPETIYVDFGGTVTYDFDATDPDLDDTVTFGLYNSPEGSDINSSTGVYTWKANREGAQEITIEATDGTDGTLLTFTVVVEPANAAPVWETATDTVRGNEGELITWAFESPTDPNPADVVTVSAGNLPGNAQFNQTSRTFSWTPGFRESGTYSFVLTASDQDGAKGYKTVVVVVANVNQAPTLSVPQESYEINQGEPFAFSLTASDPDLDLLTLAYSSSPEMTGAELNNRTFSWDDPVAGTYSITFTVSDPGGLDATAGVELVVSAVNRPPEFVELPDTAVDAGAALELTLSADDPDGDQLAYELVLASETSNIVTRGASLTGDLFSWTPAASDIGPNIVKFRVSDPDGSSDLMSVTITVTGRNITAPVAFAGFDVPGVTEGSELVFELPLEDSGRDRDSLDFWMTDLPEGAEFDSETGTFSWTPGLTQSGDYSMMCGVNDGQFQDIRELKVRVLENDVDPVLEPVGDMSVDEGGFLAYVFEASDASSGEQLAFSASGLPSGAVFYELGLLSFKPGYDQSGSYDVTVTAEDASGNQDQQTFTLTVVDVNRKPEISAENQTVAEGRSLTFTVSATDPDGDAVSLGAGVLPSGASFTASTGIFSWTPTQAQSGNYEVLFTASDDNIPAAVDTARVIISVGNVNRPPKLDPVARVTVFEGESTTISLSASDPDQGDAITFTASGLPSGARLVQTTTSSPAAASIIYTPSYTQAGVYTVVVTATDNDASDQLSSRVRFEIEVVDVDVAPQFTGDMAGSGALQLSVDEGSTLTLDITASDPGGDRVDFSVSRLIKHSRLVKQGGGVTTQWIFAPKYDQAGSYRFDVIASDGGQTVSRSVVVTVNEVNRPPRVPAIEEQQVAEGDIITFAVDATDPDGDAVQVSTAGRVPFLTAGDPPPASVRDGNVFIFDTALLPEDQQIESAVFYFWAADSRGAVSDTVQVEIKVVREASTNYTAGSGNPWNPGGMGLGLLIGGSMSGLVGGSEVSGFLNPGGGGAPVLLAAAGDDNGGKRKLALYTYMAGDYESQFYGIRRGWGVDLTAFAAAEGADSLAAGTDAEITLSYLEDDLPTEIPNFSEARIRVFGYDASIQDWVPADSQSVDTTANTATFMLTNPNMIDYTLGAVLDVVSPVLSDLTVSAGGFSVDAGEVDTLYDLGGSYEFSVNITDDEVVSSTDAKLYYAVGEESFREADLVRGAGVNLFAASIEEGELASGTVISYYVQAMDEMNVVTLPEGAPATVYQLVVLEYTGQPGDLDGNQKIDIFDLLGLLKILGGKEPPNPGADLDNNGKTDIFDLLELLKKLAG